MTNAGTAKTVGLAVTLGTSVFALGFLWYLGDRVDPFHKNGIHSAVVILMVMLLLQVAAFFLKRGL